MKKVLAGAAVVALLVVGLGYAHVRGLFVEARSPAELDALLAPHDEVFRPAGAGPFPAVVLFHGCGGLRDSLRQWAETLRDLGALVVATNSYDGRAGLDWGEVCAGRALLGAERAGDVWASLARVGAMPEVDAARMALVGWSHGAWAVMELYALAPGERPPSLGGAPDARPGDVAGLVLFYPYCGFAARARRSWHAPPTLMLLAGEDSITPAEECTTWAEGREGVETNVYPGVDHGFDQAIPSGEWELTWNEEAGTDARRRVAAFLGERLGLAARRARGLGGAAR